MQAIKKSQFWIDPQLTCDLMDFLNIFVSLPVHSRGEDLDSKCVTFTTYTLSFGLSCQSCAYSEPMGEVTWLPLLISVQWMSPQCGNKYIVGFISTYQMLSNEPSSPGCRLRLDVNDISLRSRPKNTHTKNKQKFKINAHWTVCPLQFLKNNNWHVSLLSQNIVDCCLWMFAVILWSFQCRFWLYSIRKVDHH